MHKVVKYHLRLIDTQSHFNLAHLELTQKCPVYARRLSIDLRPTRHLRHVPSQFVSFIDDKTYCSYLIRTLVLYQIANAKDDTNLRELIENKFQAIKHVVTNRNFVQPVLTFFQTEEDIYEYAQEQQIQIQRRYVARTIIGTDYEEHDITTMGFRARVVIGKVARYKIIDYFKVFTPHINYIFNQPDVLALQFRYSKEEKISALRITDVWSGNTVILKPKSVLAQMRGVIQKSQYQFITNFRTSLLAAPYDPYVIFGSWCENCTMSKICHIMNDNLREVSERTVRQWPKRNKGRQEKRQYGNILKIYSQTS